MINMNANNLSELLIYNEFELTAVDAVTVKYKHYKKENCTITISDEHSFTISVGPLTTCYYLRTYDLAEFMECVNKKLELKPLPKFEFIEYMKLHDFTYVRNSVNREPGVLYTQKYIKQHWIHEGVLIGVNTELKVLVYKDHFTLDGHTIAIDKSKENADILIAINRMLNEFKQ